MKSFGLAGLASTMRGATFATGTPTDDNINHLES
jgi:hypothetical protein